MSYPSHGNRSVSRTLSSTWRESCEKGVMNVIKKVGILLSGSKRKQARELKASLEKGIEMAKKASLVNYAFNRRKDCERAN
jgi:hypothetical protein